MRNLEDFVYIGLAATLLIGLLLWFFKRLIPGVNLCWKTGTTKHFLDYVCPGHRGKCNVLLLLTVVLAIPVFLVMKILLVVARKKPNPELDEALAARVREMDENV